MTSTAHHSLIWTGSYTVDSGGQGEGIGAISAGPDGTLQWLGTAATADSPSFIAVHPTVPVVYAVGEQARTVQAYRRSGDFGLEPFGDPQLAGAAACHVAVDPLGRFLIVSCWGDGQVLLYELDHDGGMAGRFPAAPSVDPHQMPGAAEQRPSRAHASLMLADGRIMTTDLGHDTLRVWQYVPGVGLAASHDVILPAGSGPRHLVQHSSGSVCVVSEYSIEVFVVKASQAGTFELLSQGPATFGVALPDDAAAEICFGPGGSHAYVGVRGSNRIGVLAVSADGSVLTPQADFASGGNWPRHHLVRGQWLHVAHERSGTIATFELDTATGLPGPQIHALESPSPTALVPAG